MPSVYFLALRSTQPRQMLWTCCQLALTALRTVPGRCERREYTRGMNIGKSLAAIATAPVRVGLAAADAGLGIATSALSLAHRSLGEPTTTGRSNAVVHMLGIDDAITRANRLARFLDDDAPMGRALATDGPIDRLLRPDGVVDLLTQSGGLLDPLTAQGGGLERALKPGGLVDQLVADGGLIERVLAEDGLLDRLLAEDG